MTTASAKQPAPTFATLKREQIDFPREAPIHVPAFHSLEYDIDLEQIADPAVRAALEIIIFELDILREEAWARKHSGRLRCERLAELATHAAAKLVRSDIERLKRQQDPDLRRDMWQRLPAGRRAAVRRALERAPDDAR